jgi:hypothetical protein
MVAERLKGKAVLLIGDLNMKHRGVEDVHWEYRHVCVPVFSAAVRTMALNAAAAFAAASAAAASNAVTSALVATTPVPPAPTGSDECEEVHPDVEDLAARLAQVWPRLKASLRAKQHRQVAYANAKQAMVPKWRVFVQKINGGASSSTSLVVEIMLGKPLWSEEDAKMSYCLEPVGVTEAGGIVYGEAAADAAYKYGYMRAIFSLFCLKPSTAFLFRIFLTGSTYYSREFLYVYHDAPNALEPSRLSRIN